MTILASPIKEKIQYVGHIIADPQN